jgi:hypothetical protein
VGDAHSLVDISDGELDYGIRFFLAKNDADRRVFVGKPDFIIEHVEIEV